MKIAIQTWKIIVHR